MKAVIVVLAAAMVLSACTPRDEPRKTATATARGLPAVGATDSCAGYDKAARPQQTAEMTALPPARAGSWTVTRKITLDSFSLEIPEVARIHPRDAHGVYWVDSLPDCRFFCALEITFERDSTTQSLESYIAARRTVDTTGNPDAADWQPGPPRYVSFGGRRAAVMETACGDCASGEVLFSQSGAVARLAWNIDDREGFQPGLACRLEKVAGTFQWPSRAK